MDDSPQYWNHNTAYHSWILRHARGKALDVGCGDGLLVERLASCCGSVVGIEPDEEAFQRASQRLAQMPNTHLVRGDFIDYATIASAASFDVIVFVASIHHMDFAIALRESKRLLRPGGELLVVGLSANKTLVDWGISALKLPFVRLAGFFGNKAEDIGVPVMQPDMNLAEIRSIVRQELPGARLRHGLYYRYILRWVK